MTKFLTNKNKTITIIFAILITTLLLTSLYSHSLIIETQKKMSKINTQLESDIQDLEDLNQELYDEIDSVNSKNNELNRTIEEQKVISMELEKEIDRLNNNTSILSNEIDGFVISFTTIN